MRNPLTGEDIITLTWATRCASCGCMMPPGTKAAYVKDTGLSQMTGKRVNARMYPDGDTSTDGIGWTRTDRKVKARSRVTHAAGDACGGSYIVKAIYYSTSKPFKVQAYSAREALLAIATKRTPAGQPKPSCYIVYQGNVPVLTEVVR